MDKIFEAKSGRDLVNGISAILKEKGLDEKAYDVQKALEVKAANAGFGAELVADSVFTTDFIDVVSRVSPLFAALNGFHGRNMDQTMKVPVIGELPYHDLMPETTTSLMTFADAKAKLPTAYVTIEQKKFFLDVDISEEMNRFNNVVDIVAAVNRKLADSARHTQEAFAINGDITTAATGNVNSDDGAPAATSYYLGGNGLRKAGLDTSNTVNVGTITFAQYLAILAELGDNYTDLSEIVFLDNPQTYVKSLGVSEFAEYSKNGKYSTVVTGAVTNIAGVDLITSKHFRLTEADGKISTTPANNVKGGILAFHKSALQYGYNGDYNLEVVRNPAKGWKIVGYYFMGINTVNNAKIEGGSAVSQAELKARLDSMVVLGINATV